MPIPVAIVLAALTAMSGAAKANKGSRAKRIAEMEAAELFKRRKAYQTPTELYKILNATTANAQTGFDPETLQYLTTQTDRAFDASLSTSQMLGGDPNDFSALFNDKVNAIMGIAAKGHELKMQKFSQYLGAEQMIAASKDAEWQSEQNMLKDEQQAVQARRIAAAQEQAAGTNMIISAAANYATSRLYSDMGNKNDFNDEFGTEETGYDATRGTGRQNYRWSKKLGTKNLYEYNTFQDNLRNLRF